MKLHIPHCKQKMTLVSDCVVDVVATRFVTGNFKLLCRKGLIKEERSGHGWSTYVDPKTGLDIHYSNKNEQQRHPVTFPKGTKLMITKLYIRNGGWFEDCVNFKILESPDDALLKLGSLTLDLDDMNKLDVEMHGEDE